MNKKTKIVFISSTFEDLKNHRRRIWELLEDYDVSIRGMEEFGARKEAPLTTCLSEVEQCDVFLGLIAFRLGSIDEASGKSFTQREYERAVECNKEVLIYMIDERDARISPKDIDFGERREKLIAFKSTLKERHTIDTFISEVDLAQKVKRRFDELIMQREESKTLGEDEYSQSKRLIERFLLLPRMYSGHEAKLKVDFVGPPFPASKLLCSSFNLDFGKTIGIAIEIKKPQVSQNTIPYVFIDEDNIANYFDLEEQNNIEVYGKLQFSDDTIDNVCANFVRREEYDGLIATKVASNFQNIFGHRLIIEADGHIILKLTKVLSK